MRHATVGSAQNWVQTGTIERLEARQLYSASVVGSSAVYATIQAAVNAAPADGTIRVTPGTYDELVTINKPLRVLGAQAGVDARSPFRGRGESIVDGALYSIGNRSSAFDITANDVTIDGFTVQGQTNGNNFGAALCSGRQSPARTCSTISCRTMSSA